MDFQGANILSTKQFNRGDIELVVKTAEKMEPFASCKRKSQILADTIVGSLFYEPSTRTRSSFESAALRLGGKVITTETMKNSSLSKGETLRDTGRVMSNYVDVIVMRHADEGSVAALADGATVPVINAGDGPGQHPTQALLDVYTIGKERGTVDGLTVAMVGDLKFGRTVHSLTQALSHFDVKFLFVSPKELKMPQSVTMYLKDKGIAYEESDNLAEAIARADVVYMTRVQQERFTDVAEYERLKHAFVLTRELLEANNPDCTVMHPLPRVGEITEDVDQFPGAAYFRQAANGVPVRMALYAMVLGKRA